MSGSFEIDAAQLFLRSIFMVIAWNFRNQKLFDVTLNKHLTPNSSGSAYNMPFDISLALSRLIADYNINHCIDRALKSILDSRVRSITKNKLIGLKM